MKKLVSLVLAMVLMVSMFALLGTVTASAETFEMNKTLVNLTFDGDAPGGIPVHRGIDVCVYENGYVKLGNKNGNAAMAFFGKDGSVGTTPVTHTTYAEGGAEEQALYNDLFIFEANKTYKVTVDYKYLAGTNVEGALPGVASVTNPLNASAGTYNDRIIKSHTSVYNEKIPQIDYTLTEGVLAEDTEWKTIEFTFTTKEGDSGFAFGINADKAAAAGRIVYAAFDNFKVEEPYGSYSHTETDVYTMDDEVVTALAGITGNITYENDAEKGKVVKIVGGNAGRAYIPGTPTVKANTKYYVTFDAKGITAGNGLNLGVGAADNPGAYRLFIMGFSDQATGSRLFINGVETEIVEGFGNVKTSWQSYGVIIDTGNADFLEAEGKTSQGVLHHEAYIIFGANNTTVYFDNIKIVEVGQFDSVVPEKDDSAMYSIREESNEGAFVSAGLRFRGTVETAVKAGAEEIGFVIAPVEAIAGDADWYEIPTLNAAAKTAVAYDSTKDVIYDDEDNGTSYQLVLKGLSNAQGQNICERRFAAVIYVKTNDAYSYISLGEMSYAEVAAEYAVRNY